MEMDLNQDAAVKTTGTNILVSASAGAGKTIAELFGEAEEPQKAEDGDK